MNICSKHDCAVDGNCQACNWEARALELEADLQAARFMLIDAETRIAYLEELTKDGTQIGLYDNPPPH